QGRLRQNPAGLAYQDPLACISQHGDLHPVRQAAMSLKTPVLLAAAALLLSATASSAPPMKLTAQDYIDIKMLSARYAQVIENCTNKGYDYANLYTPDGEFGGTNDWDVPPPHLAKGPDALAAAANG